MYSQAAATCQTSEKKILYYIKDIIIIVIIIIIIIIIIRLKGWYCCSMFLSTYPMKTKTPAFSQLVAIEEVNLWSGGN